MNQPTPNHVVQSTESDVVPNGLDRLECEQAISSCHKSGHQETIATLDVTPEEINLSHNSWKHSSQQCLSQHIMEDNYFDDCAIERRRSETWTSGITEKIQINKTTNMLHSDNFFAKAKQFHGSDVNLHSGAVANHRDSLQRQSISSLSDNHSEISDSNTLAHFSSNLDGSGSKRGSVVSNHTSSNNSINCAFHHLNMCNSEESQSEFTDINLQSNGVDDYDCCDDNNVTAEDDTVTVETVKQTGKPTIGSFFEWISSTKSPSPSTTSTSPALSSKQSVHIKSDIKNKSTPENASKFNGSRETSATLNKSPSSVNTGNGKILGVKNFGHSIKSTLASKGRFWKNQFAEPLSTTALILEDRPRNLPTKSNVEAEKHRLEYEKMVENAKKHELRDVQKRKKHLKAQRKQEEAIATTSTIWTNEILPNWNTMSQTSRTRQLWWQGLPPSVRGRVWRLAIGNELNITEDLYSIMVNRAHDKLRSMNETQSIGDETESLAADRECTVELIRLDISRTFPHLCIFQKGGPYHDLLHDVLGAYASYRPDVGYVQGMSFMAAMLLLNMDPSETFITFANLLNKPCQVAFFRLNEELMKTYFATFEVFFEENLPKLFAHFKQHNLTPDMYLIDWIFTMFSKALGLDTASRVWDMFCRDGEDFLFKTAIAILKLHEDLLLRMEFIHAAQLLTRLPASNFTHQQLFNHVADVIMVSRGNRRWKDVLSLMKDAS